MRKNKKFLSAIAIITLFALFQPYLGMDFGVSNNFQSNSALGGLVPEPTCQDECAYCGQSCAGGGVCGNYDSDSCLECSTPSLPSCTDECAYCGQRTCSGSNYYKVCGNYDSDSCLDWSSSQYCGAGYICQSGSCLASQPSCTDECSSYGQRMCSGTTTYQTCGNYDTDSCLEWSNTQYCPSGQVCQFGVCVVYNQCPTCTDECSYYGQRRCYDSFRYQTCGNYDCDSCLEWSSSFSCASGQTCQNGQCVSTCSNECSYSDQTEYQCSGGWAQKKTCGNYDTDSCLEWSSWTNVENCDSRDGCVGTTYRDYYCSGGSCSYYSYSNDSRCAPTCSCGSWSSWSNVGCGVSGCSSTQMYQRRTRACTPSGCNTELETQCVSSSTCAPTCTNECSYSGQIERQCSGNHVQKRTCGNYDSDSCLEWSCWSNEQNCGESGWANEYQCSSSRYLQRKWINRGCSNAQCFETIEWKNWQDCSVLGKICQNGQCVLPVNNPPIANAGPDREIFENQNVVLEGSGSDPDSDSITFSWYCSGGTLSNYNISQPTFYASSLGQDATFSCTLTVTDQKGASASDSMNVLVKNQTLYVTLEAIPSSGSAPLYNVDLRATVSGTATGSINYKFDCQNDGSWEHIFNNIYENPKTVIDACHYLFGGTYNAKVYVERGGEVAFAIATITVSSLTPVVDIKANGSDGPLAIPHNTSATLSWTSSNVNYCYATGDWSGTKATTGSESTGSLISSKTYTITCTGSSGSTSDSVTVNVVSPTLFVSLGASPSSGCLPLANVSLTATVSGSATDSITYFFDCTNDGIWERVYTTSTNTYTAYNICNFSLAGTYYAKVRVERAGFSAENTIPITVNSCYAAPSVDIKANNFDGPITIPHNSSAILTWTPNNVTSCQASGAWSGTKATTGSESTGNLTSSKIYIITCWGLGGTVSDSVTVNVVGLASAIINKYVRNLSDGTNWLDSVAADPTEFLAFWIEIIAGNTILENVVLKDILPGQIIYQGELKVDNISFAGDLAAGLNLGNILAGQKKVITFKARLADADQFPFGQTQLTNTVSLLATNVSASDTAQIIVTKKLVAGITTLPTGLTNNIFFDSFFLPLLITLFLIFAFKSHILNFQEWLDLRKKQYLKYRSQKVLASKIAKIKTEKLL